MFLFLNKVIYLMINPVKRGIDPIRKHKIISLKLSFTGQNYIPP